MRVIWEIIFMQALMQNGPIYLPVQSKCNGEVVSVIICKKGNLTWRWFCRNMKMLVGWVKPWNEMKQSHCTLIYAVISYMVTVICLAQGLSPVRLWCVIESPPETTLKLINYPSPKNVICRFLVSPAWWHIFSINNNPFSLWPPFSFHLCPILLVRYILVMTLTNRCAAAV